jgi:hypothetical protein
MQVSLFVFFPLNHLTPRPFHMPSLARVHDIETHFKLEFSPSQQARFGKGAYGFVPDTYCMPRDRPLLLRVFAQHPVWIVKPVHHPARPKVGPWLTPERRSSRGGHTTGADPGQGAAGGRRRAAVPRPPPAAGRP